MSDDDGKMNPRRLQSDTIPSMLGIGYVAFAAAAWSEAPIAASFGATVAAVLTKCRLAPRLNEKAPAPPRRSCPKKKRNACGDDSAQPSLRRTPG